MSKKFSKLISEKQSLCLIEGKLTEEELIYTFLNPTIEELYIALSQDIISANLINPHHYRFSIQVHAQEVETK